MKTDVKPIHTMRRRRFFETVALAAAAGAGCLSSPLKAAERLPASPGRRIGFVDLNLDNYHANVFLEALRGPLRERGFELTGCSGTRLEESRVWAEKNRVPFYAEAGQLDAVVDAYMILAPSNPEVHWELCQRILPFGKPTYVDKTFAPDVGTAEKIFALADKHGTPIQTSSALRYTNVQEEVAKLAPERVEHMITWGGGGSFDEYAIHPLELLISVMGPEATRLKRRGTPELSQLLIDFSGGRTGVVHVFPKTSTSFAASFTTAKATRHVEVQVSRIFEANLAAILDFFGSGRPNVDRRESLTLMRILAASRDPRARETFVHLS